MDSLSQLSQPILSYTNIQFWNDALVINVAWLDAESLLQQEIAVPLEPAADASHTQKFYEVKALIMQSLPNSIIEQIPTDILKKSTSQIIRVFSDNVPQNNVEDHDALEAEARGITLTSDTIIKAYVKQHLSLRTKMFNAEFLNISDERTTVKYLLNAQNPIPTSINLLFSWPAPHHPLYVSLQTAFKKPLCSNKPYPIHQAQYHTDL